MMSDIEHHKPVLLDECIDALVIKKGGTYIDGTFGRGGHSQAILEKMGPEGQLIVVDKDLMALAYGKQLFDGDPRVKFCHGSFAKMAEFASQYDVLGKVDGILLDLGVSSPQLDEAERGFSFLKDGPLDMRMDPSSGIDAATWLGRAKEAEIADVLYHYGEERFSRRIARAIVNYREQSSISTTKVLADIVKEANPAWEKHKHPATRSFQAIRIFINKELDDLHDCLPQCLDVLAVGGRLAVISFHSLEDRIVKRYFHRQEKGRVIPKEVPVTEQDSDKRIKRIGKAVKPQQDEVETNVRSRSAILRIGEKLR